MNEKNRILQDWLKHRSVLETLLENIPDEHLQFKPWEGAMTLSELAQHIAASAVMFVQLAKQGNIALHQPESTVCTTTRQLIDIVRKCTATTQEVFDSLTQEELDTVYESKFPQLHGPRINLLKVVRDHEIHHKAQLYVYARMVGVKELPFFI